MTASTNRRLVVGTTPEGRSTIVADAYDIAIVEPLPGYQLQELWSQETLPGRVGDGGVRTGDVGIEPSAAGALVRILTIDALPSRDAWVANPHGDTNRHVLTLVTGTIDLVLEDTEVTMTVGDTVVMSGHVHDWRNTSGAPAVLVYTSFPLSDA